MSPCGETILLLSEMEDCITAADGQPEKEFESNRVTESINTFLAKTDTVTRVAFVLRYFNGESIASIAKRFKVSESKIKSMLFRVRKKLRIHLEKEGVMI